MRFNRTSIFILGIALILLLIFAQGSLQATPVAQAQATPVIGTLTPESFLPLIKKEPTWTPTPTPTATITPTPTPTPVTQTEFFCNWASFVSWEPEDTGVVDDTLTIEQTGEIISLVLYLNIGHSYVGDLIIELEHADTNNLIEVINRVASSEFIGLGCPSNNIGVFLDDTAAVAVEDGCNLEHPTDPNQASPALSGDLRPNEPLSSYDGEDLSGDWVLYVEDLVELDAGMINAWCIVAEYSE